MHQYRLPEELDKVSQQQGDTTRDVVELELEALDIVVSEAEQKRRGEFYINAHQRQLGYDELYRHGFGKTVVIDTELEGRLSFRVSQATCDYASIPLGFATPDSPLGRLCRVAKLGMKLESPKWGEYTIVEIRNFSRYSGKEAAEHIRNFRVMESQSLQFAPGETAFNAIVSNLRAALHRWFANSELAKVKPGSEGDASIPAGAASSAEMEFDFDFEEPVMLEDADVGQFNQYDIFGRSEQEQDDYYGLSTYFFLNPTDEQLEIMTNSASAGPMLVEGVAGSGKTCAALGRAKTLCDLARSPDDEQFNSDFLAESSVGFVRTGELMQYLHASCLELDIGQLPIQEYAGLVYELAPSRNLLVEVRRSVTSSTSVIDDTDDIDEQDGDSALLDMDDTESAVLGGEQSKTRYHNLALAPGYDVTAETRMSWLHTISEVIGWRIAKDLQQQLTSLHLPEKSKKDAFVDKAGNGEALLGLLKERLENLYQPLLAQLRGQSAAPFALDSVINQIHQAQSQLERDLFDKHAKWVNPASGEWRKVRDARQAVAVLRELGAVLVGVNKRDRAWTDVIVEVKTDLINLVNQGASVYRVEGGESLHITDVEDIWQRIQRTEQTLYCCFPGEAQIEVKFARDFDDINIRLLNEKMGNSTIRARMGKHVFKVIEPNPYGRQIKQGQKPTSLEKLFKAQLRRIYRKWQFADLYRDALLSLYEDDKQKAAVCAAGFDNWQLAAERLQGRQLAEHDKTLLLALAHIMTRGLAPDAPVPGHLTESRYYRSVFIDEVQDFTEQQIFLMAEQADPKYHAVTLVGDMHQQLGQGNVCDIEACFPYRPLSRYLLKENKRQERQPQLAATAMLFRALVQQDSRLVDAENIEKWQRDSAQGDSRQFYDVLFDGVDELLLKVIERQPHGRTIAVVCPEKSMAISLEARLRGPLASRTSRSSHVADRIDLAKKYMVHFSCAEHVKGLEFDTLIYVGLEHVDWDDAHQLNKIYVTLSRPRKQLVMFGDSAGLPAVVRDCLLPAPDMESY
ncbi:hypothetical protein [Shewanella indica]|uniref:hypothetical protein n=1 Tax=Shewanella indica TaxID=768528 RepID=UPI001F3FE774|nr:hypothetical protein [Shewanella indica]